MPPEMSHADQVCEKITSLQSVLLANHPRLPGLLREIHCALKEDPEVVTLLSEEQISTLIKGLSLQTNTEIIAKVVKEKVKKNISVDDL